ncbi:M15 family metallopeptidase [Pseudoalteromonas sp. YIC-656]|uniref:M15 family metallopeptidase n=1 Tax=Pseudoalteromonas pernae TaxID=3118054 RepID=UPI00324210D2
MRAYLYAATTLLLSLNAAATEVPANQDKEEFVAIASIAPDVIQDIRYFSDDNFVGAPVDGYEAAKCILHRDAAKALAAAQEQASKQGYTVKVFDCYRPQRAVDHFVRWVNDETDLKTKSEYYPNLGKDELLGGYIAAKSGHSRGATVDLTLVDNKTGEELDMGSPFDMFDTLSNTDDPRITEAQRANRYLLRDIMVANGFAPYAMEWWHFSLNPQPYADTYFDFVVK